MALFFSTFFVVFLPCDNVGGMDIRGVESRDTGVVLLLIEVTEDVAAVRPGLTLSEYVFSNCTGLKRISFSLARTVWTGLLASLVLFEEALEFGLGAVSDIFVIFAFLIVVLFLLLIYYLNGSNNTICVYII